MGKLNCVIVPCKYKVSPALAFTHRHPAIDKERENGIINAPF